MIPFKSILLISIIFVGILQFSNSSAMEEYSEELDMVPLSNGYLLTTFKFLTRRPGKMGHHYNLFPKAIGEIVQRYAIEEFHLSMSQNYWRTYQWGYQPQPSTPTGAQLWAWMDEKNGTEVDTQWKDFVHAMSGLFCASFARIDTHRMTVRPENEFRPRGVLSEKSTTSDNENRFLRYAVLPSDHVCTENLTPWKKLLPCKSLAGLGSLLSGTKLFTGHYFALNVDLRRICPKDGECSVEKELVWELTQTLSAVFDMAKKGQSSDWSLNSIFGNPINSHCPVAKSSVVYVDVHKKQLKPKETMRFAEVVSNNTRRRYAAFDIRELSSTSSPNKEDSSTINIMGTYVIPSFDTPIQRPLVDLQSFVAGSGVQSGRLISRLYNKWTTIVPVMYSHTIPWFLRTYYHTLKLTCLGETVKPTSVYFKPGRDRQRPHYLELAFDLPPTADGYCDLSMDFDRALLHHTEYPPDANHGFPVAAPMISFYAPSVENQTLLFTRDEPMLTSSCGQDGKKSVSKHVFTVVYGKSLLVNLPTPDFSMPYNVICLVCTVVALAFGPIHSLTTKTLVLADAEKATKSRSAGILKSIKDQIKSAFKMGGKEESEEEKKKKTDDGDKKND